MIKLTNLGSAHEKWENKGTPDAEYQSAEFIQNIPSHMGSGDVWAAGVAIFRMWTGKFPFSFKEGDTAWKKIKKMELVLGTSPGACN